MYTLLSLFLKVSILNVFILNVVLVLDTTVTILRYISGIFC